jgi:hypothetical protein
MIAAERPAFYATGDPIMPGAHSVDWGDKGGPELISGLTPYMSMTGSILPGRPAVEKALAGLGCSCRRGMGDGLTFDGTGLFGSGLFSGGLDVSNWTWAEYLTLGLGAYVLTSVFHTTRTATRAVRRKAHAAARA